LTTVADEGRDAITARETIAALRKGGFPVVLPWLSDAVFERQTKVSLRRAITAQMAGQP
jgi:cell division inhibitor SulA